MRPITFAISILTAMLLFGCGGGGGSGKTTNVDTNTSSEADTDTTSGDSNETNTTPSEDAQLTWDEGSWDTRTWN